MSEALAQGPIAGPRDETLRPPASVVTERRVVRWLLIAVALTFLGLFLVLPLLTVFAQALAKGWGAYFAAFAEPDAQAAIRLTLIVAAIAVPFAV